MATRKTTRSTSRQDRVAIVDGVRTPFARQSTAYRETNARTLAQICVAELMARTDIDPALVDQVVYGQVAPSVEAPNIAREVVLGTGMDPKTDAYSVSRACATSFQAAAGAIESILAGNVEIAVAGGADSTSVVPVTISQRLQIALLALQKAKTLGERAKILSTLRGKDLVPVPPAIKEFSTGLTMGESAEQMAKDWGISREEQDEIAHRSHTLAAKAWADGKLDPIVMHTFLPPYKEAFTRDNCVREGSELSKYARLKPVFDRAHGTVTAANSSPLTDGAASLLIMKESRAKELGLEPLGFVRSHAFAALDPRRDLLMGPTHATPIAFDRAGVTLADMTVIEMHEAFAAQIACNLRGFASKQYARDVLGRDEAIGEIDMDKFNVWGGSIAFGHPFAATGARMIMQTLHGLRERGGGLALTTACAAGGIGAAMVLEVDQ
jgi:acetyl-CoA acyltransferase